jgi:hypothetical protein
MALVACIMIAAAVQCLVVGLASVALFRTPLGLPAGLPDCPFTKGRPRCFKTAISALMPASFNKDHLYVGTYDGICRESYQLT